MTSEVKRQKKHGQLVLVALDLFPASTATIHQIARNRTKQNPFVHFVDRFASNCGNLLRLNKTLNGQVVSQLWEAWIEDDEKQPTSR